MGIKIFGAKGIDQKTNNLLLDPATLRDARNVMININGEYTKRPGTDVDADFNGDSYSDVIFIKSLNEYFFRNGSDYYSYKNNVKRLVPKYFEPTSSPTSNISLAEYLNTALFTHEQNPLSTAKYDGGSVYRAGVPVPSLNAVQSGVSNIGFISYFYEFCDGAGNRTFGPIDILPRTNTDLAIAVNTIPIAASKALGFYNGFIKVAAGYSAFLQGDGTAAQRTVTYSSISDSIVVGLKIPMRTTEGGTGGSIVLQDNLTAPPSVFSLTPEQVAFLEIESINTTLKTITFTAASFNRKVVSINAITIMNISCNWMLRVFESDGEVTGYTQAFTHNYVIDQTLATAQNITYPLIATVDDILLSDIYDITNSKLRPPICKYISTYGYQIVCQNVSAFWNFNNESSLYNNNDLVMYSDLSTGDTGENFSESNRQLIGNTYDGQITGGIRSKDSFIVFKDKGIFALDGLLLPGQYSMRKIETNEIGCPSINGVSAAKSLLSADGIVFFQGQDGLYGINGYTCKKVTNQLDPFFRGVDPSQTRSVMNNPYQQYLFFTSAGIVVFDYNYNEWFIWDSIDASKGITVDNQAVIKFFNPTSAREFINAKNDGLGVAINAYIKTAWHNMGEPGLLKKATDIRVYSFNQVSQTIDLTYFLDWNEGKNKGPYTIDMLDTDIQTRHRNLDIIQNQSFSFMFENNVVNQDLYISGYEVSATVIQLKDKNVK